ncbi:ThiF family adenylyltransferase [Rhodococcus kroppenstedtii]|uniref:ThiF family adenylyltransferase n=1 Tax=Rhodococcoides kroppenstedtii TaxID=293050 RepID=UPI002952C571|nr:ThiF family adenylyltransferase [Rhodococcus kroppenstedtii]MDV7198567.1 ThiF family adenylyltransferase [Rhodococcus kroppenstedtii]
MTHRVFDPRDDADTRAAEVLRRDESTTVIDTTAEQALSLGALLPTPVAGPDEPVRWVHYPWRRSLVRVLGPVGFRRLRLDRNRDKLALDEQARALDVRIGVVGLSVGHAVAHTLALEGLCGELRLADFDELDLSNLNRVPATVFDLGVNKSVVAARRIAEVDPYLTVRTFPTGVDEAVIDDFLDGLDLVIEECDSVAAKFLVREHARRRGIPVIMETSDGGVLDVERFDLDGARPFFHGLLGDLDLAGLASLSAEDRARLAPRILGAESITPRMAASLPHIGTSLSTWPQLAGDVALGGASVAAAVRAFVRGEAPLSGRLRVGLDAAVAHLEDPLTSGGDSPAATR